MLTKFFTATVLSVGVGMSASATSTTTAHNSCNLNLKYSQEGFACSHSTTHTDCCDLTPACCEQSNCCLTTENACLASLTATSHPGNAFRIERPTANSPPC